MINKITDENMKCENNYDEDKSLVKAGSIHK